LKAVVPAAMKTPQAATTKVRPITEWETYVAQVRIEPATEKQKAKLRWFGYGFDEKISKGEACDALDKCARDFPDQDRAYYNRAATSEQLAKLHEINHHPDCLPDQPFYDFDDGEPLSYGKAKDLIQEWEWLRRQKERETEKEELDFEFTILEFLRWRGEINPHLTYARVKNAALALDQSNPGWIMDDDCQNLLLQKVAELYSGTF
jgi:hypothetical protein